MVRRERIKFAAVALVLFGICGPARADDCESRCGSAYCGATDEAGAWKCDEDRRNCMASCRSEGSSSESYWTPAKRDQFGAIAYSGKTGGYGFTYNYTDGRTAESDALGYCEQDSNHAGDCRILISFYNNCGALARASDGTFGAGWGDNSQLAQSEALRVCASYGGRDCGVLRTVCNGG